MHIVHLLVQWYQWKQQKNSWKMLIIFIVNKKDTRTPIFFVIFEHIFLVFLSLTLNKQVRVPQEIRLREIRLKNINPR